MKNLLKDEDFWVRLAWFSFGVLVVLGERDLFLRGMGTGGGEFLGYFSLKWGIGIIAATIFGVALLAFVIASIRNPRKTEAWFDIFNRWLGKYSAIGWLLVAASILFPVFLLFGPWGWRFGQPTFRVFLVVLSGSIAGISVPYQNANFWLRWALGTMLAVTILTISERFLLISDNPFPLSWSEGNRLWDYSLYFLRDRYDIVGEFQYPTYLTPGRHGLWGLPFLFFPSISILGMRIWDGILWTIPYFLLGGALFLRRKLQIPVHWKLLLLLWTWLFLSQGPIYAPLILAAAFLLWGYDREKPRQTLLVTFLASLYAGLSRWTWMIAPATWSVILVILDEEPSMPLVDRLKRPLTAGIAGLLGAAASVLIMDLAFPRPDAIYSTSISQPLLWERLWSSPTNPTGIVPGLVYAIGPLLAFLIWAILSGYLRWDQVQIGALLAAFLGFLGIGLVASVKIGGGSNLHNLDMLLVTLVILVGIVVIKKWIPDTFPVYLWGIFTLIWFMPILNLSFTSQSIEPPSWDLSRTGYSLEAPTAQDAVEALATVRAVVQGAAKEGEVLFIDQRQLLTFGEITGVPLVMEYELKHVMNQAMGHNEAFFEAFRKDIKNQRFSLIVSDPLAIVYQGSEEPFGEENDAWVGEVSVPILESYEPVEQLNKVLVWLLVPKVEDEE